MVYYRNALLERIRFLKPDFFLSLDSDILLHPEDKGKVRPVDYLFTLNRTRDEEKDNVCRIYIEAAREYKRNKVIYIKQNLSRSRFYDRKRTLAELFEKKWIDYGNAK